MTASSILSRVRRYRALAAFTLGLAIFAPNAGAAPQISAGTWTDEGYKNCTDTFVCTALFTAVPAGKTLVLRNASCAISAPSTAPIRYLYLDGNSRTNYFIVQYSNSVGGHRYLSVNNDIFVPFVAGQKPTVTVFVNAFADSLTVDCTLSGELKAAPTR